MRLDLRLFELGLVRSREQAARRIRAGAVHVNGQVVTKPSRLVSNEAILKVTEPEKYVGRGGLKLEAALDAFETPVSGMLCLDVGASTGGFTDCLLQRGAARVIAIDVGHGQMVEPLRRDKRVEVYEGINARELVPRHFGCAFDLVVMDVSFIPLRLVLPAVVNQVKESGWLIALIKPQFELSSEQRNRQGVVKNSKSHDQVVEAIANWFKQQNEWDVQGVIDSPVLGGNGNKEFLICARK